MTKFLNIAMIVMQLFPALINFIRNLEQAFPAAGQGARKLEMLGTLLEDAFKAAGVVEVKWAEVWPAVQRLISSAVALFNTTGEFRKASLQTQGPHGAQVAPVVSNVDPS